MAVCVREWPYLSRRRILRLKCISITRLKKFSYHLFQRKLLSVFFACVIYSFKINSVFAKPFRALFQYTAYHLTTVNF